MRKNNLFDAFDNNFLKINALLNTNKLIINKKKKRQRFRETGRNVSCKERKTSTLMNPLNVTFN